ncbi:ABC transporter permease [Metabacillus halosaccharovorans]|uniref:ABC transporter permease n=1 Tax=Metabacillus halosaccharovorans TaxID=930124 RepID=UPI001C1F3D04|nr:FtsX-like permease family protein [Metabacillus halosaccharovorans]MBU7592380.1 FtsX-like permease family protein [Metabacillus halosaccharovorans]
MNIMNKLTARHLIKNKRRTLITIIGVIISVAMITAVATLGVSFLDLMKRQTIASTGDWHVQYKDITKEQLDSIANDESTSKLVIANDLGYSSLKDSQNRNKPYLFIREYNEQGYKQFPIEVSKGRLPKTANEVIISEEIIKDAQVDYKLGDKITMEMGQRILPGAESPLRQNDPFQQDEDTGKETLQIEETKTFTIVGMMKRPVWEPTWSPGYSVINYIDSTLLTQHDLLDAFVVMNKVNGSLYDKVEKIMKANHINKVEYNEDLLRYYGVTDNDNLRSTLFSLAAIIMVVIIIGSVALIYNAFAISVSERARHLGMLSSVGATKKQKRNSVFFEGSLIGSISIPVGITAGIGGIAVTFWYINTYLEGALGDGAEQLEVVVTPYSFLIACFVSIITIFISTYLPARKASKISAIDAIRQTQDIKLTGKTVKTSKLVRKIFGIEAEIGLKNVKRNKKRYRVTVFSLIISIILFLSVSFFTDSISKSAELSQDGINYDIQVSGSNMTIDELKPFSHLDNVTDASVQTKIQLNADIQEEFLPNLLMEMIEAENLPLDNGKYEYYVNLYGLDESNFRKYAESIGTDVASFTDTDKPNAIVIDKISYQDFNTGKFIETNSIEAKPGEKIDVVLKNYETEEHVLLPELKIGALTEQVPFGVISSRLGGLDIIVPQKTFDKLTSGNEQVKQMVETYLFLNSSDPLTTQKEIEDATSSNVYIYNVYKQKQNEQQLILFLSVFTYGFIALISLISIANIFNTISTSISLRKREFAMLKSVGLTPRGFNKMIYYESIFYGVKALLYGLPISGVVMFLIYWSTQRTFEYGFQLPWLNILFAIAAIFIIVGSAMLYSIQKIKRENIIDGLIQENI